MCGRQRLLEIPRCVSLVLVDLVLVTVHDALAFDTLGAIMIADVTAEPLSLATPVDGFVGLEGVGAATSETEGWAAHGLKSDVAGKEHQVGP